MPKTTMQDRDQAVCQSSERLVMGLASVSLNVVVGTSRG
jgi:hypothetical protein